MKKKRWFYPKNCFVLLFWLLPMVAGAQNQTALQQRKQQLQQEIEYTQTLLRQTSIDARASVNQVAVLQEQIKRRSEMIETINDEVYLLNIEIEAISEKIDQLETDLEQLKEEYAKIIYFTYKNRSSYDKLLFVLSAENFNQSYRRFLYLQQYASYRREQAELLLEKRRELSQALALKQQTVQQKEQLMQVRKEEAVALIEEREHQQQMLATLRHRTTQLRRELQQKQQQAQQLEDRVVDIITAEIDSTANSARQTTHPEYSLPENFDFSGFRQNKGKLPWPVASGVVTSFFGVQEHPVLAGVQIVNNGIDINTGKGAIVRAVYGGIVKDIVELPGANKAVLVAHGEYYTLYSNLVQVDVARGEAISTLQKIGTVFTDAQNNNQTILKFQVWHLQNKLNPMDWLSEN